MKFVCIITMICMILICGLPAVAGQWEATDLLEDGAVYVILLTESNDEGKELSSLVVITSENLVSWLNNEPMTKKHSLKSVFRLIFPHYAVETGSPVTYVITDEVI